MNYIRKIVGEETSGRKDSPLCSFAWLAPVIGQPHTISFLSQGSRIDCFLSWQDDKEVRRLALSEFLSQWPKGTMFVTVWERLFLDLDTDEANCDYKYLRVVAAAGVAQAREHQAWPFFLFDTERILEFIRCLPSDALEEFLQYCKKEWMQRPVSFREAQRSSPPAYDVKSRAMNEAFYGVKAEFGGWVDAQLDFILDTMKSHTESDSKLVTVDRIRLKCDTATFVHLMSRLFGEDFDLFDKRDGRNMPWTTLASIFEDKRGNPLHPKSLGSTKDNIANTKDGKPRGARKVDPMLDELKSEIVKSKA